MSSVLDIGEGLRTVFIRIYWCGATSGLSHFRAARSQG